jgi:uncharacterized cupin superfamily protein
MNETSAAAQRLLSADLRTQPVERDGDSGPLNTASVVLGGPVAEASSHVAVTEVGVWEAGPGRDADVELDELFLVLAGSGSVTFDDGSTIHLRPGVLVRLYAGDRTQWSITQRLRKLYLA